MQPREQHSTPILVIKILNIFLRTHLVDNIFCYSIKLYLQHVPPFSVPECTYENWPRTCRCVLCGTVRGQTLKSSASRNEEESRDDDVTREHHLRRETPSPQGASYSKPISTLNSVDTKSGKPLNVINFGTTYKNNQIN